MAREVIVHRDSMGSLDQTSPSAIIDLLRLAIDKNIPVDALERLQALHERVTDRQAAAEFAQAVAEFQAKCPQIGKNAKANITTKNGGSFSYSFADLTQIAQTIKPHLLAVGLSYTWDSDVKDKQVVCTCILRHLNGHRESAKFTCPVDSSAGMSEQQKYAAALSFARRQSLVQVLGLTTVDPEAQSMDPTPITEQEAAAFEADCERVGIGKARLLNWLKVNSFAEIPARRKMEVAAAIEERAAKGGQK